MWGHTAWLFNGQNRYRIVYCYQTEFYLPTCKQISSASVCWTPSPPQFLITLVCSARISTCMHHNVHEVCCGNFSVQNFPKMSVTARRILLVLVDNREMTTLKSFHDVTPPTGNVARFIANDLLIITNIFPR